MDEEGSKDRDEGRDDVGVGMASGCEGSSLGRVNTRVLEKNTIIFEKGFE